MIVEPSCPFSKPTMGSTAPTSTAATLEGLRRLSESLKALDDRTYVIPGHYERIPTDIQESYQVMQQGADLVHATSTKYTLLGKISSEEANKISQDLLKGCQLIATGALVIGTDSFGCCRSTRIHTKRACRAVVATVTQLVEVFGQEGTVMEKDNNIGAQKCGAVWQSCDTFIKKKMPQGNRNAMRRDLFTWIVECSETMQEFHDMIDGSIHNRTENGGGKNKVDIISFEDFCQAGNDRYSEKEIVIAKASVALIKCSRGTINVILKSSDTAGKSIAKDANEKQQSTLEWIGKIHDMARDVGEGMTDLGTLLYPTLSLDDIENQGNQQANAILTVLEKVLDADMDLDEEETDLGNKIRAAVQKRLAELNEAIAAAR